MYMRLCEGVQMCVCVCECINLCICVCVKVCICVSVCVCVKTSCVSINTKNHVFLYQGDISTSFLRRDTL